MNTQQFEHRARIGMANALTVRIYFEQLRRQIDSTEERAANLELAKQLESAGVAVRYLSGDEILALLESDKNFSTTHLLMPISDGAAAIDGMHPGNFSLSSVLAGELLDMERFVTVHLERKHAEKRALQETIAA